MLQDVLDFAASAGPAGWALAGAGLVAGGLAVGIATAVRGLSARSHAREMADDLGLLRTKYAAASHHLRFVRRASLSLKSLPPFEFEGAAFGPAALPVKARSGASDVVQELADSLNHNISSSITITDLIIDGDLENEADRKTIAAGIKREAGKLDPSFWGRHGKVVESSDLPAELKSEIKKFYVEVATLKQGAGKLGAAPSPDDILAVGLKAVDVLQCAATIYDIIERSR